MHFYSAGTSSGLPTAGNRLERHELRYFVKDDILAESDATAFRRADVDGNNKVISN